MAECLEKEKEKERKNGVANGEASVQASVHPRFARRANVGKDTVNVATNSGTLGEILSSVLVHPGSNRGP